MTQAVCIKCGHQKLGALTPCLQCRFSPEEAEDQAKSILLSDHHLEPAQLEELSKRIQRGEPLSFDGASLRELKYDLPVGDSRYVLGVRLSSWIALGIAIFLGLVLGGCLIGINLVFGK